MKNKIIKIFDKNNIILFIVMLIAILPSFRLRTLSVLKDMEFWIKRVDGLVVAMNNGVFPYRINSVANSGYGGADPIFYPYLFMYIVAILYKITNNYNVSFNIFYIFVHILTTFVMYYSVEKLFGDKKIAYIATIINLLSYCRLRSIYVSICIGEYLAIIFIPLVIEGYANVMKGKYDRWIDLLIGYFFILQTHIITAFYVGLILIFVTLFFSIKIIKDKYKIYCFIKTIILIVLLNLWFYVPLIQYYISNKIEMPQVGTLWGLADKLSFIDSIILTVKIAWHNVCINVFNNQYDRISYATLFIMFFIILNLFNNKFILKHEKAKNINDDIVRFLLVIVVFNVLASTGMFTRTFFGKIKFIQNIFNFEQFENRELKRALPLIYIIFSYYFINNINGIKKIIVIIILLFTSLVPIVGLYNHIYVNEKYYDDCKNFVNGDYILKKSFEKNPIYEIKINNKYTLPRDIFDGKLKSENVKLSNVKNGYLSYELDYERLNDEDAKIVFPLFNYYGYTGSENNKKLKINNDNHALISVFPNNDRGHIVMKYTETALWIVMDFISLFSFIMILILTFIKKCCKI